MQQGIRTACLGFGDNYEEALLGELAKVANGEFHDADSPENLPAIFGHELAGEIVEMGSEVQGFRLGQRVVAANSAPCGECRYCLRDRANLCDNLLFNNGAYAEYIKIPGPIVRQNMLEIPEGIKVTVTEQTKLKVEGADKQLVGAVTAEIRGYYPPEPYKGKGVRIVGERVRRKEGKTVA